MENYILAKEPSSLYSAVGAIAFLVGLGALDILGRVHEDRDARIKYRAQMRRANSVQREKLRKIRSNTKLQLQEKLQDG